MSLRVKLDAALIALGLDPRATQFDHDPALGLRPLNEDGTDTVPPQLDPKHIVPRSTPAHRTKTTGTPPGQKVVHVANGDQHKIAKAARLERARRADLAEGRFGYTTVRLDTKDGQGIVSEYQPVTAKAKRVAFPPGRKMQSRPFPKKAKP